MLYSLTSLDRSIELILPDSRKWPVDRLDKMKIAIEQIFMFPDKYVGRDFEAAIDVIRAARLDLYNIGQMTFGTLDIFKD